MISTDFQAWGHNGQMSITFIQHLSMNAIDFRGQRSKFKVTSYKNDLVTVTLMFVLKTAFVRCWRHQYSTNILSEAAICRSSCKVFTFVVVGHVY